MHGRLKVRSPEEQQELVRKEKEKKLLGFQKAWSGLVAQRSDGNLSSELLPPTEQLLTNCPDLYTLWNYRREILLNDFASCDELGKRDVICQYELSFTENCLTRDPKSYSVWNHRKWTLDQMTHPDWTKELALCNRALEMDERNFHVWGYRRFVVERGNVPLNQELAYSTNLIKGNFSNYSSWHYRTILLPRLHPDCIPEEQIKQELNLVVNAVYTDPNDQSTWFYSQFLVDQLQKGKYTTLMADLLDKIKVLSEEEEHKNEWVLHAYVKLLLLNGSCLMDDDKEFIRNAVEKLCLTDPLRSGYYESLKNQV